MSDAPPPHADPAGTPGLRAADIPAPADPAPGPGPERVAPAGRAPSATAGPYAAVVVVALLAGAGIWYVWQHPRPDAATEATAQQAIQTAGAAAGAARDAEAAAQSASTDAKAANGVAKDAGAAAQGANDAAQGARATAAGAGADAEKARAGLTALGSRIYGLEATLASLGQSMAAVQDAQKQLAGAATAADVQALTQRVDQLAKSLNDAAGKQQSALSAVNGKLVDAASADARARAALGQQVQALQQGAGEIEGKMGRAAWLGRLQTASAALEAGQPLGHIEGAPPSLARYATAPPPTLASLRAGFAPMADAVRRTHAEAPAGSPWYTRALDRLEQAVTIRRGGTVIVGDPSAGPVAAARTALDADDLAGAVAALDRLQGPAAQVASGWKGEAQSVLDARTAIAAMMAHA